jgi:integrase
MGKATGRHQVEKLSAVFCKQAGPGRHGDGRGLYLIVEATGARRWMQRVVIAGKRRDLGLGGYPAVSLAEARQKALANLGQIEAGANPLEAKRQAEAEAKAAQAVPTFNAAVDAYLAMKLAEFRNGKHRDQWRSTLATYAGPVIGTKSVDQIDTADILRILQPIWASKTETASRLRGRIEAVMAWAIVAGHRTGPNPASWRHHLDRLLPKPGKVASVENQPALSLGDVPAWWEDLRQRDGMGALALQFLTLTACRSGEVRGASWSEVDFARGTWTIPAARMKAKREHRIPLSPSALALLHDLPRIEGSPLLFPAIRGGQLSDMTLSAVMRRQHEAKLGADRAQAEATGKALSEDEGGWRDPRSRRAAVPHGLRSTFRQWAAERGFPRDMAEMALAHFIGSEVERAYQRSDMLERRRAMMADWAAFLTGKEGGNVIQIRGRA